MLSALRKTLFGGASVSVQTISPAQVAAQRLSENTPSSKFRLFIRDTVVGSVTVDRVVLFRVRPFFNFAGAPVFRGRFISDSSGTHLDGTFHLDPIAKVFMTFWFGFVGIFCIASLILGPIIAAEENVSVLLGLLAGGAFALAGIAFGCVGYYFLRFIRWLSQSDINRVVQHIEHHAGPHAV